LTRSLRLVRFGLALAQRHDRSRSYPPIHLHEKRRRFTPAAAGGLPWWASALLSDGLLIAISSSHLFQVNPLAAFGVIRTA